MTPADIERFLRAFWASDWEACAATLAVDAVYEDPLLDAPIRGRDQILDVFRFCHSWASLAPQLRTVFGEEPYFCAELRIAGTITSAAEGIPQIAIGRSFNFAESDVFEVAEGRITRMSVYADVVSFQAQIGA